jgi:glycosyltransferase involved in cell wall biosynthesis
LGETVAEEQLRRVRVLHMVSSEGVDGGMQSALFMPLLTRMPKQRVKAQLVTLGPGVIPSAVVRQQGVPVHDLALSRRKFSLGAFGELLSITREFRPDVIQAWGLTAQLAALLVRARCDKNIRVICSAASTLPLPRKAGFIDRQKLALAARVSKKAERIVYSSEAGASQHERAGYSDHARVVIPPGVDATRFKADPAARARVRDQLELPADAFVIGMHAPFQPEFDHATLIKAVGELLKTNPNIQLVLAGHGVNRGNASLMAMIGGGALSTHVHLLGEWSDVAALFNACDLVCSSAITDVARMSLVGAMLCDVPCVATGMGAQGEVIGQFGIAVEPGNPAAFVRAITRVLQMPEDRLAYMIKSARKHALKNFVQVSSLQKYLKLYHELIGRESLVTNEADEAFSPVKHSAEATRDVGAPSDSSAAEQQSSPAAVKTESKPALAPAATVSAAATPLAKRAPIAKKDIPPAPARPKQQIKDKLVSITELADPDSLEARRDDEPVHKPLHDEDVLELFESSIAKNPIIVPKDTERARGVAEEMEDLLPPEMLVVDPPPANAQSASSSTSAANASAEPDGLQLELIPDEPVDQKKAAAS